MILQALLLELELLRFFPSDLSKEWGREATALCAARERSPAREGTERGQGPLPPAEPTCLTRSTGPLGSEVRPGGSSLALSGLIPLLALCRDRLLKGGPA